MVVASLGFGSSMWWLQSQHHSRLVPAFGNRSWNTRFPPSQHPVNTILASPITAVVAHVCRGGLGADQIVEEGQGEAAEDKGGPPGLLDAPPGVLLEVKKEAVVLLGGGLGGVPAPVLRIGDFVAQEDSLGAAIDAEMCTVAAGDADASSVAAVHAAASTVPPDDAEMSTVAAVAADTSAMAAVDAETSAMAAVDADTSAIAAVDAETSTAGASVDAEMSAIGAVDADTSTIASVDAEMSSGAMVNKEVERGGGKGEEESKDEESESSEDEELSEASSSSDEEEEPAKNDEESSEASSSSDEEVPVAKKHSCPSDMEALLEEGELMAGVEDEDDDETPKGPIKSKHEVEVLPPVPKIEVQLEPHHKALPVGTITAIMGERVIVEGSVEHSPLTEGSILWITESRTPLGIVDEIFGPVKNPYYLVRYNSVEEVPAGISAGTTVCFVVEFADHILNMKELYAKGYDESADHDEEADEPEFSDDEQEAEYKRSLRLVKRQTDRPHDSKKPSGDKKRAQTRGAGFRNDMPPRIHNTPTSGHQSQRRFHRSDMADSVTYHSGQQNSPMSTPRDMPPRIHDASTADRRAQPLFHRSDMATAVADSATRQTGPQNFSMSAPKMLPSISMNHAMPSPVQLANQMGSCFINPQQFSQQPNMVWPGGLPPPGQPNMGVDGAALAANIMQNILMGANQFQQYLQNQNFGGFPNGMPMAQQQFMPGSTMSANMMPFGGPPVNHPFGQASQFSMGQGNFGQFPHMAGNQGPPAGFPNTQGFGRFPSQHEDGDQPPGNANMQGHGRLPSTHGDGGQPPMQFNSLPSPRGDGGQQPPMQFNSLPSLRGDGGQPPMQFNSLPSPRGDGGQPPMQFNSGQFNQGNSSFRGRRPQQRGGRHSPGRGGGGGRHRK
ncbi:H/ACA ribonucleoprotein complex non-core subunit NAF1 [Triticum urartu]|uniref:H/ACA ribonucleoprotein complex non-core subunit NAF1 n=1 Tax=Triticum urartu TaxID=4572 RepID=M7ZUN7_TRIUA|nr:H/ACA ribonucleoprotein complex non-core subunit NAF1 [Triticum urartu]